MIPIELTMLAYSATLCVLLALMAMLLLALLT